MKSKLRTHLVAMIATVVFMTRLGGAQPNQAKVIDRRVLIKLENSVAAQFTSIRKTAGLHKLSRIKNRPQLRQMICTAATTGQFKQWGATFYETTDFTSSNPSLEQMATFDAPHQKPLPVTTDASVGTYRTGGMPNIRRFAIAVWPSKVPNAYWVGVGLYWNAGWEWFDLHLTDDYYYGNLWKKSIATECRNIR